MITETNLEQTKTKVKKFSKVKDKGTLTLQRIFKVTLDFTLGAIMEVNPSTAEQLLKYNTANRPLNQNHMGWLSMQMKEGLWRFIGNQILWSKENTLLNAQHTLNAIIDSGKTQRFLVLSGIPKESMSVIDTGRVRTAGDVFALNNVPNANACAGIINKIVKFEHGYKHTSIQNGGIKGKRISITHEIRLRKYLSDKDGFDFITRKAMSFYTECRYLTPSIWGLCFYLARNKDFHAADEFFTKLAFGVGLKQNDPVYAVRRKLEKEYNKNKTTVKKTPKDAFFYWIAYGWNKFRQQKEIKHLPSYNKKTLLPEFI